MVTVMVVGVLWYFGLRKGALSLTDLTNPGQLLSKLPVDAQILSRFTQAKPDQLGGQISSALDALVTHPDRNSPVVLGVKVTNESIGAITDVLMGLPPDKLDQIKSVVCTP